MKIKTLEDWSKELIYYNKSVAWIDKFGIKHALWSKVPSTDENGDLVMVNNVKKRLDNILDYKRDPQGYEQRKLEEAEYDDEDDDEYEKINIMGDTELKLDSIDVHDLDTKLSLKPDPILNDVEILS